MNGRETIQLGVIGALCVLLLIGVFTNFGRVPASLAQDIDLAEKSNEVQDIQTSEPNNIANSEVLSLSSLFKRTENSVVQITSKVSETNSNIIINGNPLERQSTKLGSGFVYSDSGLIITNNHVIKDAKTVDVTFVDGNTYSANVTGTDPYNDIAVLQIIDDFSEESLIPLALDDSSKIEVGDPVAAIGNPFGLSGTMTSGIVSQIGRLLPNQEEGFSIPNVIQTDAAINPGNSGGPLLNLEGRVIGINTAIQSNTGEFSGVGFAVPSNTVKKIVPVLIEKGKYDHPWLGMAGTSLTPDIIKKLDLPKNYKGVLVTTVVKDSPADEAGLLEATFNINREIKNGDIIISIDGNKINSIAELILYLSENKAVGDDVSLEVNRNGNIIQLNTVLKARPSN
ncbi:S1C family serine protease [Candidatus Nitrosotenuis aquarius]|uniref:S1C family serine protease n=1 Tax=Candidatus Nitrosotenuis aquarius TaxID=1846278 RepID=UPI000C1DF16F|nr:trypsin-like peptidase domain-containing protein [Candidatus Nitrosotenuis aquarius]